MAKKKYTEQDISILEWREAVRLRPAMYLGSTGFSGFTNLVKAIMQNLFFQTKCSHFEIDLTDKLNGAITFYNLQLSVKDSINEDLQLVSFEFAAFNALSQKYEFTLFDENQKVLLNQVYQKGVLKKGKVEQKEFFSDSLKIDFELDNSIWDFEKINVHNLNDEIRELAFLCNEKKFELKYQERGEQSRIVYNFENGLLDKLEIEKSWVDAKIRNTSKKEFDNFSMDLAFGLSPFYYTEKFIGSYVNFSKTEEHGTHVIGLIKVIKKGLKLYLKKHFPDKKIWLKSSSVKKYLFAAIHIQIEKPAYCGPTRSKLQTYEIIKPISKYVAEIVLQELEKDPKSAEDIVRHFEYV